MIDNGILEVPNIVVDAKSEIEFSIKKIRTKVTSNKSPFTRKNKIMKTRRKLVNE